jgi:uncharacterized protein YndB with AHSA1/START domain
MTVITSTTLIDRLPEDVFDYCVDLRNELEWNPDVEKMEKVTDGPVGVGTRYQAKWKQSKVIDVECTAYNRPHTWTYLNGGPVVVVLTIRLSPEGQGTRLEATFDATPKGMFRLVFPIFVRVMKRAERKNMTYIKTALERR